MPQGVVPPGLKVNLLSNSLTLPTASPNSTTKYGLIRWPNIPDWFLNRQKDYKDGKNSQVISNAFGYETQRDLERLKKIRSPNTMMEHLLLVQIVIHANENLIFHMLELLASS
ncbi:hypothetical protein Leryth_027121 [Lithospermum erythrorhizon]|nr:hypothetical protein Leryth_027121 [Lithospermum erythrorhizon]